MIDLKLSAIADILGCEIMGDGEGCTIGSIVSDSRKVQYGTLFAALQGSQVDGHDFAAAALELGATALLVERPLTLEMPQLVVPSVLKALGQIAAHIRREINPIVVGITGSNGKTTAKEMIANILRTNSSVLSTQGNFNNELGLPLSLFGLEPKHRHAVLELGAAQAGDVAYLSAIASPDVALITNVGPAHLQGFGNEEGVARAKGEIFAALPARGWAIMNGDEPWISIWREISNADNELTFGCASEYDVFMEISADRGTCHTPAGSFEVRLTLPGRHNLINAAGATAVAISLGYQADDIAQALARVTPVPGRLSLQRTYAGWAVIDDTYNANPASLYSALQVLSKMQGKAWLVLGDMKELGENSRKMHVEVGDAARGMGVQRVFATGEMCAFTVDAFGSGAAHYPDRESLLEDLLQALKPGINCLVKGSRSMGMEWVAKAISDDRGEHSDIKEAR